MNRTYDRAWYIKKVDRIREIIPECAISADVITGFCSETEEEHQDTLSIIEYSQFIMSYMFFYSERPGTLAERKYEDDIPLEVKKRRLSEVIKVQAAVSLELNKKDLNKTFKVLIDGYSKKSNEHFKGRNSQSKVIIFPMKEGVQVGDYVHVKVDEVTSATLKGHMV